MDWLSVLTHTPTLVCLLVLFLSFVLLILHYALDYLRVGRRRSADEASEVPEGSTLPGISVVLVVHNEAEQLRESLPFLLEQEYPNYEIVVVNVDSKDETPFILQVCKENYDQLKPINFEENKNMFKGKKYPLSIGIKCTQNEIIVLSEARCVPLSFNWLQSIAQEFVSSRTQIVLGYCHVKQENTLLNLLQQYDNLTESAHWIAAAMSHHPFSGTATNMALRRNFFFDRQGFSLHYSEPEGADDMFVNQNATGRNTKLCIDKNAFVQTEAQKTWKLWHQQRARRYATKRYYSFGTKLRLAVHPISVVLFYAAFALMFVFGICPWYVPVAFLALKLAWQIITFRLLVRQFTLRGVHWFAPFFEIYFLFANTISYIASLHRKNIRWR